MSDRVWINGVDISAYVSKIDLPELRDEPGTDYIPGLRQTEPVTITGTWIADQPLRYPCCLCGLKFVPGELTPTVSVGDQVLGLACDACAVQHLT
jgi:hypothetical protein